MALQTQNLVMTGLGILGDSPPNAVQPPLVDGIHLRWAFKRELGFPWFGFYLFRRFHREGDPRCFSAATDDLQKGPWPSSVLDIPGYGRLSSDQNLNFTDDFDPPGPIEFDLDERDTLRFSFPPGEPARWVEVQLGFRAEAKIEVAALLGDVPVVQGLASGGAGDVVSLILEFDAITAVEIQSGPAALIELCAVPVAQEATQDWQPLPDFPYPLCLPLTHPDYPCSGGAPVDLGAAESVALGRVLYGAAADWAGLPFNALHDQLLELVVGGPASTPMADRSIAVPGTPVPPDPGLTPPQMPRQYPLDLVLLGTLHPAIAQMVGLYWADKSAEPGAPYDYLILADRDGRFGGDPEKALSWVQETRFSDMDGYIVFNKRAAPALPLPAPTGLRVYALPGSSIRSQGGAIQDAGNNAGLRWQRGVLDLGAEVLLPERALMYHLWRVDLGEAEPGSAPPPDAYQLVTKQRPLLVAEPHLPPGKTPQRPPDWPPFPLHTIDGQLPDGWYSYQVNGIDIFGRHSPNSAAGAWYQWIPLPDPRPWYYQDPPGDTTVHPFAVRLLDKMPPPPPTAIEAYALDPADPLVLKDAAYNAWWATLSPAEQNTLIGLRVSWHWTEAHMRQAPDTREFRIYFHPGTNPPPPDHSIATNWQERYYVVGYNEHVTVTVDAAGRPLRKYELFLPAPGDAFRDSLPLTPSLAEPIVYAHIGISAADDKTHTLDDPQWAAGRWGGAARFGNEGRVGPPAKVFRVRRIRPDPPAPPPDAERVYATPADYHSHSFYTYRWQPQPHLKTHIFRALDDAVFKVDWTQRPRPALASGQLQFFPDAATEPRWDALKRQQIAAELNQLNGFSHDATGTAQAMAAYRALSNDGLRVLAGLPGNEQAFTQLTIQPLDPADPATANRIGPDNPPDFVVDPALRAYVDTLDGRSTNRYFYRAAYVDGANNRSDLSLSGPPIWLPNVVPPRTPVLVKVLGGDREIILKWASNRESDLSEYWIYRTDDQQKARDIRLVDKVQIEPEAERDPSLRSAEIEWHDTNVAVNHPYWYRIVAVDNAGNISQPCTPAQASALRLTPPTPPMWVTALWKSDGTAVDLQWAPSEAGLESLIQRRLGLSGRWKTITSWLESSVDTFSDSEADPNADNYYRIKVRDSGGNINADYLPRLVPPKTG